MTTELTDRQQRIAALISDGFSDKEIATLEMISDETVGYHVARIVKLWHLNPSKNIRVQITKRWLDRESQPQKDDAA